MHSNEIIRVWKCNHDFFLHKYSWDTNTWQHKSRSIRILDIIDPTIQKAGLFVWLGCHSETKFRVKMFKFPKLKIQTLAPILDHGLNTEHSTTHSFTALD